MKTDNRRFNPEKYHMNFCHESHRLGKIFTGGEVEEEI
jgi:hypothetical protein